MGATLFDLAVSVSLLAAGTGVGAAVAQLVVRGLARLLGPAG